MGVVVKTHQPGGQRARDHEGRRERTSWHSWDQAGVHRGADDWNAEYRRAKQSVKAALALFLELCYAAAACAIRRTAYVAEALVAKPSFVPIALFTVLLAIEPMTASAGSFDHLVDFTGKTNVIVTLKGHDTFTSEYRYDISVRNLSPDSIIADSLVIVLDKITNLAGADREGLTGELFLKRFDIPDQDGQTDDGKPYFRIPVGTSPDLVPQTESLPVTVRIRNRDYVAIFTPSFRVLGEKRPPPEPKRAESPATPTQAQAQAPIDKLIQLLIKKGVLTEEEWRKANRP
jgi:hypothetical protein